MDLFQVSRNILGMPYLPEPWEKIPPLTQTDRLILAFDQHLERVHGLSAATRRHRRAYAKVFLSWRFGRHDLRLRALRPMDLPSTRFATQQP